MDAKSDSKRRMDKHSDNEDRRREKKSRRHRFRSRSYEDRDRRKRKHSRSRSPNVPVKQEKRRDDAPNEPTKKVPERKAKETDMLNTRTGGAYIPPARLRMMQAQITDKSSVAYQRLAWEALKKSIHGHINKINVGNIGIIIKELLKENIVRGRGLLCRSVIQAQAASPTFTNVYAALVAAVNSRFPNIGELLLKRLVIQFKRGFKRNDKPTCISSASFIAHLVNQRVAHEILALELLTLLVESPTDDSVEVAIAFLKECGQKLTEVSSKGVNAIFEMLRNILHEGQLDKRVQYMIEVMFQVWKDGFKDHPALIEELELVPEEEQFTHLLMLDDATDPQDILNVFKFDDKYEDNEQKYKTLSKEILGSDAESGEEDGSEESGSDESDDEGEQEGEQKGMTIIDNTETNLVALRRTIYLTINSSLDFEECAHKLMKMQLKPGQEVELCHMFLDCCAEQRTYEKFYGLLAQRFCNINRMYIGPFEEIYKDSYATAHRLDTNRLRNVSKFFAHLLFTDSISWEVMECVKLNEEDTTSSSRIYIKILFQELAEYMGLKKLNDRLRDPTLQDAFSGIFPRDNPKNTRFSINFFTSIGLGGLTDELREHLKQMPKNVPAPVTNINLESDSSSESSSSSSSDSSSSHSSSSDSEEESDKKKKSKKSKEKENSKPSNDSPNEETSNKENNDKDKRWGHDGFYDTYGENARRHENRQERPDQNRDSYDRSRDTSRRYGDRERHRGNERENTDGCNREVDRRRNDRDRDTRELEELRGKRTETDTGNRRPERERIRERRIDTVEDRRDERKAKDYNRKDDREDKRQGNDKKRSNYRDEHTTNKTDQVGDRTRDQNSRKENRDKSVDKNDRVQDTDRNSYKNSKDSFYGNTRDKSRNMDERENRIKEVRDIREKKKNETDKTNKHDEANDDDDTRNLRKEGRKKVNMKEAESREKETEGYNSREDKGKSNNRDLNNTKNKSKKNNRDKYVDRSNSSNEESENESDSDDKDSSKRNRDKDKRKRQGGNSKKNKDNSEDRNNSKNKSKKTSGEKLKHKRQSSQEKSENDSSSDNEDKTKRNNVEKEKHKRQVNKSKKKDRSEGRTKNKRDKYKEKEISSQSSSDSNSESSSDYGKNETSGRYWDTFDIENRKAVEKSTNHKVKSHDRRRER